MDERVSRIEAKTEDAYSYDRYSRSGWRGTIKMLLNGNWTEREVEAFLRSKYMRWAADMDATRDYGQHNSRTVSEYLESLRCPLNQRDLDELVAGTF